MRTQGKLKRSLVIRLLLGTLLASLIIAGGLLALLSLVPRVYADPRQDVFVFVQGIGTKLNDNGFAQIENYLKANSYQNSQYLYYSYSFYHGDGQPNPYDCVATYTNSLQTDIRMLGLQINAFAKTHPGSRFHIIAHSLGGVIAYGYLAALVEHLPDARPLPIDSRLGSVSTLDTPLGGVSDDNEYSKNALLNSVYGCHLDGFSNLVSVQQLQSLFHTAAGNGSNASIVQAVLGGTHIINQVVANDAKRNNITFLSVGNKNDMLWRISGCGFPTVPDFPSTQWVNGYSLYITLGSAVCPVALGENGLNHGAVLNSSVVDQAILRLVNNSQTNPGPPNTGFPPVGTTPTVSLGTTPTNSDPPSNNHPTGDGILFCDGSNASGACILVGEGKVNLSDVGFSNRAVSLKFQGSFVGNYHVVLHSGSNQQGDLAHYDSDAADLGSLDHRVESVEIYKRNQTQPTPSGDGVQLCNGASCTFYGVGNSNTTDSNIQSVKFLNGCINRCHVVLHDQQNQGGTPYHLDSDSSSLGSISGNVKSLEVYFKSLPQGSTQISPANGTQFPSGTTSVTVTFQGTAPFTVHVWAPGYDRWVPNISGTSYTADSLTDGTTYKWQVIANVGNWSSTWTFSIASPPTPTPTPTTPPGHNPPVNAWIIPNANGFNFTLGQKVTLTTNTYPQNPGDAPVMQVIMYAYYSNAWHQICFFTKPDAGTSATFTCNTDFTDMNDGSKPISGQILLKVDASNTNGDIYYGDQQTLTGNLN